MRMIWKNLTTNEIWYGQSVVYNGQRYFNPSTEILTLAGFVEIEEPEPEIPIAVKLKQYEDAVQDFLDRTAQSRGYDNTYTCLSYRDSTDSKWKTEANIFNIWRDAVWHKCHELLNKYESGELEPITINELLVQLPEINWDSTEEKTVE